ncbi:MAG: hypothetical protein JXB38_17360 [Anaerolineales bacterium]|nr:hypothetical protein [Anaerolineales bacterium]
MELEIIRELTQAYQLLREGKHKEARPILVRVLKDAPDNEQAWLLLSVAVSDRRRQVYALQQVLRVNPENEKALARLQKIQSGEIEKAEEASPEDNFEATEDDASLLEKRIFGWDEGYQESEQVSEGESQPEAQTAVPATMAVPTQPTAEPQFEVESETKPKPRARFNIAERLEFLKSPRTKKILTRVGIGVGGVIGIIIIGIILLNSIGGGGDGISIASIFLGTATPSPTIGFRQLPPTYTPTVTIMPTETWVPTPTPTLTPTITPQPLNPEIVTEMERIQQQLISIRELEVITNTGQYIISQAELENNLREAYLDETTRDLIEDQERILVALGMMTSAQNLDRYFMNKMVDPRGGMYRPEANEILLVGLGFSSVQKVVYAYEFDQALIDQHYDLVGLGYFPGCLFLDGQCQILGAVLAGDSRVVEERWFNQYADGTIQSEIAAYTSPIELFSDEFAPAFARRNDEFANLYGYNFVNYLFEQGGWEQVNQAYISPPVSSEQIMHPERYLAGEVPEEMPDVPVGENLSADWELIGKGSWGEWYTYLIMRYGLNGGTPFEDNVAFGIAEGWDGDLYQAYHRQGTREIVLAGQWSWDTPDDALDFDERMREYQLARFGTTIEPVGRGSCWQGESLVSCTYIHDNQTLWILAPSLDILTAVKTAYPDF